MTKESINAPIKIYDVGWYFNMKHIIKFSLIFLITSACSIKNNHGELHSNQSGRPQLDSAFGFKIGDAFVHDSLKTYGFILIKIEPELLYFSPVKVDTLKVNFNGILNGQIRLVPTNLTNPDNGVYGIQCLGAIGKESINEFKGAFKQVGHLKLKVPYPQVASCQFDEFTFYGLNTFAKYNEYTWEGRAKLVATNKILE
jgi:hypothetical protein